jgi:hypothetical protein
MWMWLSCGCWHVGICVKSVQRTTACRDGRKRRWFPF